MDVQARLEQWIRENVESFDNRDDSSWITLISSKTNAELAAEANSAEFTPDDIRRIVGENHWNKPQTMGYRWYGNPKRDDFIRKNATAILRTKNLGRIRYAPLGRQKPDFVIEN